jgi:hypothetical protein
VEVTTVNERLNAVATAHLKTFTPKARRVDELRVLGKSFDEAFAIADREFTPDGMLPGRGVTSLDSVRIEQNGMVQF